MFSDRYLQRVLSTNSHLCVGLDPILAKFPRFILAQAEELYGQTPQGAGEAIYRFNQIIIDLIADRVPIIKPQLAYYEKYDHYGVEAFWKTVAYAQSKGLLVIADAKRGDIGSTSQAYAEAFFKGGRDPWTSSLKADALTVNPYLGSDGVDPFLQVSTQGEQGVMVLVKTSNPSSGELQDQVVQSGQTVSELVCDYVRSRSTVLGKYGFSDIGVVIGATYPQALAQYRQLLPHNLFLVPGIGYQGGDVRMITEAFDERGFGAIITSSRALNYPYAGVEVTEEEMKSSILEAVERLNQLINDTLQAAGKGFDQGE